MLYGKFKKAFILLLITALSVQTLSAANDKIAKRQLEQANSAYEDGDMETAYKKVTAAAQMEVAAGYALANSKDIVIFARQIYKEKLKSLLETYDANTFIEIDENLKKYPEITDSSITKLMRQIEEAEAQKKEDARKAEAAAAAAAEEARFRKQQEAAQAQTQVLQEQIQSTQEQTQAFKEQTEAIRQQNENAEKNQKALEEGLKGITDTIEKSTEKSSRSTMIMIVSIIGIAVLILVIILIVIVLVRKGMKQSQERQEQYMQAFKLIAANQSQTNRLMLGGITDLYGAGNTSPLKLAGASTWAPAAALPDVEYTEEEQEELKQLAVKCEELGVKIDQVTGRKNNSKNVSELVYKLSMALGLPQRACMLNFCASMIYDAGFLGVDPKIWEAETLTDQQKEEMKNHVNLSDKYLEFVPKKYWDAFNDAAQMHHENLDGSGYPNGLKGDEIPQVARLIRVAETYVSMSSKRNYRHALDKETAIEKLKEQPGLYDPQVVQVLEETV